MHTAQRYRPQTALFGRQWIIEVGRMIARAGLDLREIAKCAFKFGLLTVLLWVFAFILADFNHPRAECALMHDTCVLKYLRSDSINAVKFYRILRFLNLKFSPQNLIVPKFWRRSR